jgi:hypothetical protein
LWTICLGWPQIIAILPSSYIYRERERNCWARFLERRGCCILSTGKFKLDWTKTKTTLRLTSSLPLSLFIAFLPFVTFCWALFFFFEMGYRYVALLLRLVLKSWAQAILLP